ncbi:unnamed protein product, partial [Cladocopium goreaui]
VAPVRDKFGCYPDYVVSGKLMVSTLCLPELIAGPAGHGNLFRGPSPMSAVADKLQPDTVYFSWTPDAKYGKAGANGTEGRIYVSKMKLPSQGVPVLENSYAFNGFARAGGIDMTEDGIVGTLCAKLWYPWVEHTNSHLDKAAMVLAVCEVNASSMTKHRTPWQIGKQYQESVTAPNTGIWGSYPLSAWFAQRSVGYGYLIYAPAQQMWTAWYGATVDYHTGFAMHTYHRDAPGISDEEYAKYKYPVPREQVEPREEADGPWRDHHRTGTGDHQASAAWFYHPRLKDIGLQKNTHWEVYMQQYGLAEDPIGMPPAGEFASPGHKGSRLELVHGNDTGRQANALRPCVDDWIIGLISDQGNVCAKVTRLGEIVTWKVIEPLVAGMPCGSSGGNCGDGAPGRMVRIAPLGAAEDAALCGSEARFLFGYEKPDRSRWLVELDGNCEEISEKMDVTRYTHWPLYQDWTTTRDGSVVWISAWHEDVKGDHGPPGSPNGVWPYKFRSLDAEGEYLFGLTPEATNAAKVVALATTWAKFSAKALVKRSGGDRCGALREDFQQLLGPCPVLVYKGVLDPDICRQASRLLLEETPDAPRFAEWRLGADPEAPASDYTKMGYTKTDVLIQQGFRMTATSPAPERYLEHAKKTSEYLHKVFAGRFILDLLQNELTPLGIQLHLERCPRSRRPFLPCVVRRMEPGGRRREGNVHMDSLVPGTTLSMNLYLNVPEMLGGELVLYPIRKDSLQRYLNSHFFETIDLQNFYPDHDFYTQEMLKEIEPIARC